MNENEDDIPSGSSTRRPPEEQPRVLAAELLFAGAREVLIEWNGEHYRLRITRRGKLILQK